MRSAPALVALLALGVLGRPAVADPPAPAAKPAAPSTPELAADTVLAAVKAMDDAALKSLATKDDPDPWLVADELIAHARLDVAEAFAKAAPRKDIETLPAYVAVQRGRADDPVGRAALVRSSAAFVRRDGADALAALAGAAPDVTTVLGIRLVRAKARALFALGRADDCATLYRESAAEAERIGWLARAALAYQEAGQVADRAALSVVAASSFEDRLRIERLRANPSGIGTASVNAASARLKLGDYPVARSLAAEGLAAFSALGDRRGVAYAVGTLAQIDDCLCDVPKALEGYERVRAELESLGDVAGAAVALGNLGLVYDFVGEHRKALQCYDRALKMKEGAGDDVGATITLGNIGLAQIRMGDPEAGIAVLETTIERKEKLGDRIGVAETLATLGATEADLGHFAKAIAHLERAKATLAEAGARAELAIARNDLGNALRESGALDRAAVEHAGAIALAEQIGVVYVAEAARAGLAEDHLEMGDMEKALAEARQAVEALARLGRGLADALAAGMREQFVGAFAVGVRAAVARKDAAELARFIERGRAGALLASLAGRDALWSAVIPEALRREETAARARETVAAVAMRAGLDDNDLAGQRRRRAEFDAARQAVLDVVLRIQQQAKSGAAIVYPEPATLDEIRSWLSVGEAAVLYAIALDEAYALVVTPKSGRIVPLGPAKAVLAAAEALDLSTTDGDAGAPVAALRRAIVDPLRLASDVVRVVVSPEGELSYSPFSLLFEGRDVALVPSATTLGLFRIGGADRGVGTLALGDPDYSVHVDSAAVNLHTRDSALVRARDRDGEKPDSAQRGGSLRLAPLPASAAEARAVGDVVLLGRDATIAGLERAIKARPRWAAIHLACHGLVDPEAPMLSALALTADAEDNGFLSAMDLFRIHVPADLVVLSACETGRGKIVKGEGIVGLTRAFMFAGAPRVICSLWKVDDEATRALMVKFYERWKPKDGKPGLPTAVALRKAQEFVRNDPAHPKWSHPYYWAAWVLWGLPD
jgi:tetratricopeptide (TPR) repeat protein